MTTLKEATSTVHKRAEQTDWAKLLITGKINEQQYAAHLANLLAIHNAIEQRIALKENILRTELIKQDISSFESCDILPITETYVNYLNHLSEQELGAHVYVHYLGELYGGQYIKKSIGFPCKHLDFDNPAESIAFIRELSTNVDHAEAIKAFEWTIKLYEQLWEVYK